MKKIRRIQLHHAAILPKEQMIGVIGGAGSKSYHYYLRCDQGRPNGYVVSYCDRATMEMHCDSIPPIPVCVITYY